MSEPAEGGLGRALRWLFVHRGTGQIVIGQVPNLALALFLVATAVAWLLGPTGQATAIVSAGAGICLAWWAADELLRGVNPWRRILGAGVLAYLAAQLLIFAVSSDRAIAPTPTDADLASAPVQG